VLGNVRHDRSLPGRGRSRALIGHNEPVMDDARPSDSPSPVLLRGGRIGGGEAVDLLVRGGVIDAIGETLVAPPNATVIDLGGRLVLPGLVDAHCHLDKTLYGGPWVPQVVAGRLADRALSIRSPRDDLDGR
jgi:imidazolonepropionase-like amidohydrolase